MSQKLKPNELLSFMTKHQLGEGELALTLGVTREAVRHWLAGRRDISHSTSKMVKVLDQYPQLIPYVRSL